MVLQAGESGQEDSDKGVRYNRRLLCLLIEAKTVIHSWTFPKKD